MARPGDVRINEREQMQLNWNLDAMQARFVGQGIAGKKLHLIKRYAESQEAFGEKLKENHPVLYKVLQEEDILPCGKTLAAHLGGAELTPYKTVERLAEFCTKVFAFDRIITAEDLLTQNLYPFPPMRNVAGLWGRYVGIYRCFYLYPDSKEGQKAELHGGLLQFQDRNGKLYCRIVTEIRKDDHFDELEKRMLMYPGEEFQQEFQRFNSSVQNHEARMSYYDGFAELSIPKYYLIKLLRGEGNHSILMLLRRWNKSKQPFYSGGVAAVTLCRAEEIVCHAMIVVRQKFSLIREEELLRRHLANANGDEKGLQATKAMDETLNREAMDWSALRSKIH